MKQVVLRIEDSAFEYFKAFINLCPSIEIVCEFSELEVRKQLDICIESAIRELLKNKVIRKPSDFTYIMQAVNDKKVEGVPYFYTPDAFIGYLTELGIEGLPGRSTIYDTRKIISGKRCHSSRSARCKYKTGAEPFGSCSGNLQFLFHPAGAFTCMRRLLPRPKPAACCTAASASYTLRQITPLDCVRSYQQRSRPRRHR